jgi:O-antigen biosynthesis protein WbqP
VKRSFDFLVAVTGLTLSLPIVACCMVAVRLGSPGPAIFRQTRIGLHERPFTCFKLRTMYVDVPDAPSHETPVSAVTPLGSRLRALKLDELPQLWNVVRGEMSLVGPRPCLPSQTELIAARRQAGIFEIRPGITGVSQIAGIDMSDPLRLAASDATYLTNMSLQTDVAVIWRTVLGAGRGDRIKTDSR